MYIFVEDLTGKRHILEVEFDTTIGELKRLINNILQLRAETQLYLTHASQELKDNNKLISDTSIKRESVIRISALQGGASLTEAFFIENCEDINIDELQNDPYIVISDTNLSNEKFISFMPIIKPEDIPWYEHFKSLDYNTRCFDKRGYDVHITRYTGDDYKRLKISCLLRRLDKDKDLLDWAIRLYVALWRKYDDLPEVVYHVCNMTEKTYEAYYVGLEFYSPDFKSTSKIPNLNWKGNALWTIRLTQGKRHHAADVEAISLKPEEKEIVLSTCSKFRVIEKERKYDNEKMYNLTLEYLDV